MTSASHREDRKLSVIFTKMISSVSHGCWDTGKQKQNWCVRDGEGSRSRRRAGSTRRTLRGGTIEKSAGEARGRDSSEVGWASIKMILEV